MLLVIAGVITLVLMQQRARPPVLRMYGPEPHASARVSETEISETSKGEETSEETTERVPNPRKMSTDLAETVAEIRRVPETHIVGFRWSPSSESRARLLSRQHKEMKQYTLHQYE